MRKVVFIYIIIFTALFACSDSTDLLNNTNENDIVSIIVICPEMLDEDYNTRMSVSVSSSGTKYSFEENDTLGVFPSSGDQVGFSLSGNDLTNPKFTGGGWALKKDNTYYAYSPFNRVNFMHNDAISSIPVTYTGQYQNTPNSTENINPYIYCTRIGTTPVNGNLTFKLEHVGSLARISINIPQAGTYRKVSIIVDGDKCIPIKGTVNLKSNSVQITPVELSDRIELNLNNMYFASATSAKQYFYLMIPPFNASTNSLKIRLEDSNGVVYENYTRKGSNNNFISSKAYVFDATFTSPSEPEYVSFEDNNFKSYMVSNFDKNNDGEISLPEAELIEVIDCSRPETRAWSGGAISSLSGIEHCKNLKTLICNNNEIANLDVTENTALTTLFCANNQIQNLNIVGCENIAKINCSDNKLSSLDVSTNTSLVSLVCGNQTTQTGTEQSIVVMVNEEQQKEINTLIDDLTSSISVELQTGLVSKASGSDFGNGGKY